MKRTVEPEWLDTLPTTDPAAQGSRRDLRRLNRIMGSAVKLCELLNGAKPPRRIVELGAGDGLFMLQIAGYLSTEWPGARVTLVDRKNAVADDTRAEFIALGWQVEVAETDVFDWLEKDDAPADIMTANLFLHHFSDGELARLLGLVAKRTNIFAACEPRRAAGPLALSRMLGVIGCNAVTRHDATVSVRAGFAGRELSALWPANGIGQWRLREQRGGICTHTFFAERST